ncbi:MAG: MBL fold metallo-hydrolase [Methanosarcinales archaeon]|nr:MBL fold metallo-hydrolase [Methanosarcinales archaeon]
MATNITLLGTGVAIPQKERVQSGILLYDTDNPILLDCGAGILQRLTEAGCDHTIIDNVVLSHLHLDHVADVLPLIKANWLCDKNHISIFGPAGTEKWMTALLEIYPYLHDVNIDITELNPYDTFTVNDMQIECIPTIHSMPSLGYKVHADSVFLYSGDTEPVRSIIDASSDCRLLIHECSFPDSVSGVTNHTTPTPLGNMLKNSELDELVLTHLYPHTRGFEGEMVRTILDICEIPVQIGSDMQKIVL